MNMKQHATKRRVLSILLSAMMLLSMIPATMFQSSAAAWEGNDSDPGFHIYIDSVSDANWDWQPNVKYISTLLNAPGRWVNDGSYFDWLGEPPREIDGKSFVAVLDANVQVTSNDWMDGSKNDGTVENYYSGLNVPLYVQFNDHMYSVTDGYIVNLCADDFNLTFQGPGTVMGNKSDAAIVINKGHMSFTDGIVVTNTGDVAIDVKSGGVIDLISDATIGEEGSQIGLRNEGTITSITGGTFYNFDNKGTVDSITGGTFDYSQAPEGVSFEQIRGAVAANATVDEISAGVFQVTSTEEPEPVDPNWDYVDAGRGDGSIEITNYKGGVGAVTVPAEINGHKVVGLGNGALYQKGITSLVISEGIEYLGDDAVMFNNEMTSMTLPSTLNTVGDNCFALAYALTNVDLPEACVNFVDDPDYDCALGGSKNNGLGIFYGLGDNGNSVTEPGTATVTCYTEEAKAVLEAGNAKNTELGMDTYNIKYVQLVTVTFDANGGENAPAAVEVALNEAYVLPTEIGEMAKDGYQFIGWALSEDATAEDVVTEITPTEATTVYAVWAEETVVCEHPEDQRTLVVDEEPGYYFHGVGHYVCDVCGETVEENVDIAPLPLTDAYNDVNPDGWYVPGVAMMTDLGIMSGKEDGIFEPDNTMIRSEMAQVMYKMLADPEEDLSDVELPFTDVSEDHWAINAIKWCYKHGIVSGDTKSTFAPDKPILREEFVSMLYRYMVSVLTEEEYQEMVASIDTTVLDQFPDGAAIDEYAVEAMQVFVQAGIITGSDGMLAARSACSRGQIAQILRSILELSMT